MFSPTATISGFQPRKVPIDSTGRNVIDGVQANVQQLIGGATEEAAITRVGQGSEQLIKTGTARTNAEIERIVGMACS